MMFLSVILLQLFGLAVSFLLQNDGQTPAVPLPDRSYQDIITLLVEEKNERKQFETGITHRLDQIDDLHRQVSIQLDKDRNSREYTLEKLAGIAQQLRNMSATDSHVGSEIGNFNKELYKQSGKIADIAEQLRNLSGAESRMKSDIVNYHKELKNQSDIMTGIVQQLKNLSVTDDHLRSKIENNDKHLGDQSKITANVSQQLANFGRQSEKNISNMMAVNGELSKDVASINKTVHLMNTPVGFSVSNPNKTQQPPDGPLKFKTIFYNIHNMYNMTTGIATVMVPGMYYMTTTIVREPGIAESRCCILHNNMWINGKCTVGYGSDVTKGYPSGSTSLVYHLSVGDTVSLKCAGTGHINWTSDFNGYLVRADIV